MGYADKFAQTQYEMAQAANTVAAALGLDAGAVNIGVGDQQKYGELPHMGEESAKNTHIVITANGLGAGIDPSGAEKAFLAGIDKIPALRQIVQTESNEELSGEVYSQLQQLTTDKHLLNWSGFNPDVVKNNWNVGDHAIQYVSNNPYGVEFNISVPTGANTENPDGIVEKVEENIKDRLPEIKALLSEKTIKYIAGNLQKEGKPEVEIEEAVSKAKSDMEQLNISVNKDGGGISVIIRSPAQEEAIKAVNGNKWDSPTNADKLKATNPLNELTNSVTEHEKQENPDASPQLHKTLGRAFLYAGGEKAMEVFSFVAGRRDIYNAIKKEAKNSPEKAAEFGQLLQSNLFKKQGWGVGDEAGKAPAKPAFRQDPHKPDNLELWIETPKKDVRKTIEALAAMGQQVDAALPSAIAPENFRKEGNWLEGLLSKIMPASKTDVLSLQKEQQAALSR